MEKFIEQKLAAFNERAFEFIESHITRSRVLKYTTAIMDVPAPSTTASWTRGRLLKKLLYEDGVFESNKLYFDQNYKYTGNTVIITGDNNVKKSIWYFAHLDTVSYLLKPPEKGIYPLVPFCYHLMKGDNKIDAGVLRYDVKEGYYKRIACGEIFNDGNGEPCFIPKSDVELKVGDRVFIESETEYNEINGTIMGNLDNAGAVAALAVAAPVLAKLGIQSLLAFPDEEEGQAGIGNQTFARGSSRLMNLFPMPNLVIVADLQEGSTDPKSDNAIIGDGASLVECSSLCKGAVTPPHLYLLAKMMADNLGKYNVCIQHSNSKHTPRSDDVSITLKTPNIILLGIPGTNRHYDNGKPLASLDDIVNLSKVFVYFSVLLDIYQKIIDY